MAQLTLEQAKTILKKHTTEEHLFTHAAAVSAAMGAMAEHFGEDKEYWEAVGYLHDVDYEKYPDEHCKHVRELLEPEGIDDETIETIISHGWGLCVDEPEPTTPIAKSLYTVDELTGIVQAYGLMRPEGLDGMAVKSLKKKFKDKRFAAKCDREVIKKGFAMLGMEAGEVMECVIKGMQAHKEELGF
ncbi:HDIG domain-containing metalloprotein [uncultured Selenomonas sp.]|uniref:HDIG domain-containing metalloprotein n=1 Tax=uncultured Selenomonas sp. TaxID=159275 RepID=UPI0025EBDDEE|nr:HDIG domain-containing metalloprotein [uncultured Selenomonas sp.]